MRRCERTKTSAFEEEQTEGRVGGRKREKEQRCATKQNLSRSLSSAITVETSLFLSLFSLSPVSSLLRLERGNQRG